jgi:hypothetical protein
LIKFLKNHFNKITLLIQEKDVSHYSIFEDDNKIAIILDNGREDKVVKKNLDRINEHDILIWDEYYGAFHRIAGLKFKVNKFIYIIHNCNKYYQCNFCLNYKEIVNNISKKIFLKKIDSFLVMGPNIKEYILANKETRPVFFFPFDFDDKKYEKEKEDNSFISIVIPGMVDSKRRNYKSLMRILDNYYEKNPNSKIQITFLGKIVTENSEFVANISNKINMKYGKKIIYHRNYIPLRDFEKVLIDADYILSNVYVFNKYTDRIEIYGTTKESGISFTIYKYEKVGIVPEAQRILTGFNSQLINYRNYNDLFIILENIENGYFNYKNMKGKARENKIVFNNEIQVEKNRLLQYIKG